MVAEKAMNPKILIYRFIVAYKECHNGISPSMQEIADGTSFGKTTVYYHLLKMRDEGIVEFTYSHKSRNLDIGGVWKPPPNYAEVIRALEKENL